MEVDWSRLDDNMKKDEKTFYLIVAGSRTFAPNGCAVPSMTNQQLADRIINKLIQNRIDAGYTIIVFEGEAPGADQVAKNWAVKHRHEYRSFPADWDTEGKSAGYKRNDYMYLRASLKPNKGAILFWDGESRGTLHNFYCAWNYGVPVRCFNFVEQRFLSQEEIEDIQKQLRDEQKHWWERIDTETSSIVTTALEHLEATVNVTESEYGEIKAVETYDVMIGKTMDYVQNIDDEVLRFESEDGSVYQFYHKQDCCETVRIEDICGDLDDLVGSPILMAEEVKHKRVENDHGDYVDGTKTYTFYKFATAKGYVTIRWCGSSNGYYSEEVDFEEIPGNLYRLGASY